MITMSELHCLAEGAMTTTDPATIRELATYAIQAFDSEQDRTLAAAVRRTVNDCRSDEGLPPIAVVMRFVELHSNERTDPNGDVWAVFDAIATCLRGEQR